MIRMTGIWSNKMTKAFKKILPLKIRLRSPSATKAAGYVLICIGLFSSFDAMAATDDKQIAEEILVYVNQYRVQHGLTKLAINPVLTKEAAQHSQDMAKHAVPFGHDGFSSRMDDAHKHISNALSGAENVAFNYKTAKIVVDGWIHSPGHRRNLMGNYNLTGIGIARDSQGKPYFTQMFLRQDARLASNHVVVAHSKSKKHWRKAFKGFVG